MRSYILGHIIVLHQQYNAIQIYYETEKCCLIVINTLLSNIVYCNSLLFIILTTKLFAALIFIDFY